MANIANMGVVIHAPVLVTAVVPAHALAVVKEAAEELARILVKTLAKVIAKDHVAAAVAA